MSINLHLGDCLEAMRAMPDNSYDLAIVDPPYGLERFKANDGGNSKKIKAFGDKHKNWNNIKPVAEYWEQLFRVSKNQIVWGANNFELPPSEYFLCWNKEQAMPNFATLEYAYVSMGLKKPAKLFTYSIHKHNQTNKIHPTQKPVKLYEWLLDNYAKEGDRILDTHLGSGSIALACHNRGYSLDAYEIDEEYYNAATERLRVHQSQLTIF